MHKTNPYLYDQTSMQDYCRRLRERDDSPASQHLAQAGCRSQPRTPTTDRLPPAVHTPWPNDLITFITIKTSNMKAIFTRQHLGTAFSVLAILMVIFGVTMGLWNLAGHPALHK